RLWCAHEASPPCTAASILVGGLCGRAFQPSTLQDKPSAAPRCVVRLAREGSNANEKTGPDLIVGSPDDRLEYRRPGVGRHATKDDHRRRPGCVARESGLQRLYQG